MSTPAPKNFPITFEIEEELFSKLKSLQEKARVSNLSALIRHALESYKFESFDHARVVQRQISVRLPQELKDELIRFSTKKHVSAGQLLRAAIQDLCLQSPKQQMNKAMNMAMAILSPKKAKVRKPATKKVAVKKVTTAKKPAAKKPVAKTTTVKKAVVKKAPVKKVVAKKPAVKKAAVKKTVVKKTVVKKTVAKKPAVKKLATVKKPVAKKPAVKKAAVKRTVAKKPAAKKTTATKKW